MANSSWVLILSWSGVAAGVMIILLALICFLLECKYSVCWRYDRERGNGMFEMTPTRRSSNVSHTLPCYCGYETGGLHSQRRVGRRNNSCPV